MIFIVVPIILVAILIIYIGNQNDSTRIDAFYSKIESAKESFISDEKKSELQNKYYLLYKHINNKILKNTKEKIFLNRYKNLSTEIQLNNDFILEKEAIFKQYNNSIRERELFLSRTAKLKANCGDTIDSESVIDKYKDLHVKIKEIHNEILEETITACQYNDKLSECNSFFVETTELRRDYITVIDRNNIIKKYNTLYKYFTTDAFKNTGLEAPQDFIYTYSNFQKVVFQWNQEYIKETENANKDFFNNIDGKSLDYQQRNAVIIDDINNLVLAGAGSGKTLTIAAKVKYLVEKKQIKPDEILLLSFARKASEEMTERINHKLNIPVKSYTFHQLGLKILRQYQQSDINNDMEKIISKYFKTVVLKDYDTLKKIFDFFLFYLNVPKSLQNFESLGDYIENQKAEDLESLKSKYNSSCLMDIKINDMKRELKTISGEKLRSMEEVMIANYLFVNGINYEYEKEYPYKNPAEPNRKYHPDFYFTDYDIYLEHFGITKENTLPWLSEAEEQKYIDEMKWKREFHKTNGTKLLETYSYYNFEKRLIPELQKLLDENGIKANPRNIQEIYEKVYENETDYHFKDFEQLICTFIQLYKTNGYTLSDIDSLKMYDDFFDSKRKNIFLEIIKPILEYYETTLHNQNQIDFNDMINMAVKQINEQNISFQYKYIIIDEYQDISVGRYKLIKAIINHSNAKLMCVGDDWQSIYRFTGSDLDLFTNFEKYFGESTLIKIEKTYRNAQSLLDISKTFIEMNPEQLKKNLVSDKSIKDPIKIMRYVTDKKQALYNAISEIYWSFGEEAQILLLGRNNSDINDYTDKNLIPVGNTGFYIYGRYPKMKIQFMTVHSSKGLEADNVIIINMKNALNGFPNKMVDDEILTMVLQNKDQYEFAEERRLFYVALTRTRNRTYLIAPTRQESFFLEDLTSHYQIFEYKNKYEEDVCDGPSCPKCRKGSLIIREKGNSKFLGCTNYPYCDYTVNDLSILKKQIHCPRCGGYMVWKENRNGGKYLACTNKEYCGHTQSSNKREIGFRMD